MTADAGVVLIVAAIAIPNLLRARIAANEASAVAKVRNLNVAQVMYASTYPQKGYARDLATLGRPDPKLPRVTPPDDASTIDPALGNAACTAGEWCTSTGYRFAMTPTCGPQTCKQYVIVATPVTASAGGRSFCSNSDGVVRFKAGPPLDAPITVSQCRSWSPLQ